MVEVVVVVVVVVVILRLGLGLGLNAQPKSHVEGLLFENMSTENL